MVSPTEKCVQSYINLSDSSSSSSSESDGGQKFFDMVRTILASSNNSNFSEKKGGFKAKSKSFSETSTPALEVPQTRARSNTADAKTHNSDYELIKIHHSNSDESLKPVNSKTWKMAKAFFQLKKKSSPQVLKKLSYSSKSNSKQDFDFEFKQAIKALLQPFVLKCENQQILAVSEIVESFISKYGMDCTSVSEKIGQAKNSKDKTNLADSDEKQTAVGKKKAEYASSGSKNILYNQLLHIKDPRIFLDTLSKYTKSKQEELKTVITHDEVKKIKTFNENSFIHYLDQIVNKYLLMQRVRASYFSLPEKFDYEDPISTIDKEQILSSLSVGDCLNIYEINGERVEFQNDGNKNIERAMMRLLIQKLENAIARLDPKGIDAQLGAFFGSALNPKQESILRSTLTCEVTKKQGDVQSKFINNEELTVSEVVQQLNKKKVLRQLEQEKHEYLIKCLSQLTIDDDQEQGLANSFNEWAKEHLSSSNPDFIVSKYAHSKWLEVCKETIHVLPVLQTLSQRAFLYIDEALVSKGITLEENKQNYYLVQKQMDVPHEIKIEVDANQFQVRTENQYYLFGPSKEKKSADVLKCENVTLQKIIRGDFKEVAFSAEYKFSDLEVSDDVSVKETSEILDYLKIP